MKDDLISTLGPLFLLGIIVFTIWMVRILQVLDDILKLLEGAL
jgi:hypothetical protein